MHGFSNAARRYTFFLLCLCVALPAQAGFLSFEDLSEGAIPDGTVQGLSFSNAEVLTAGSSLNEFDFPPHSGQNVLASQGSSLSINFDSPMLMVSGYFSYADAEGLTLSLYGVDHLLLAQALFAAPIDDDGIINNQFLALGAPGFRSLVVTLNSDFPENGFTLDDLAYVPEPATYWLLAIGVMGFRVSRFTGRSKFGSRFGLTQWHSALH